MRAPSRAWACEPESHSPSQPEQKPLAPMMPETPDQCLRAQCLHHTGQEGQIALRLRPSLLAPTYPGGSA